ncbi:MAG: hypothetical protein E3J72_12310 [Planctomycetota bacterium]|nr:MAG: hypothetical protein E3J72_12310 [Planctomycetota bacterium]
MNSKGRLTWLIIGGVAVIIIVIVLIINTLSTSKTTITIGAISPFSGDGANYGKAARTAIDLALEEINAEGGIDGKKLTVTYEDDKGNPKDALSAFKKLASIDKVPAILGPFYSSNVLACAPTAEKLKVVLLTGTATSDNIRNAGEYVFRVCPSNDEQARTIANFAYKKLGLKTSYILYRNVDYGVTLRDKFEKAFKELGGSIVGMEGVAPDAKDIRAQLAKVKASAPDFIFAAVHYAEGGTLLRQSKELGISSVIMGTDGGFDPQLFKIAGNAAEGSYWVTIGWGDESSNPAVAKFKEAYKKKYGEEPGVYSGLFYDATHVLAKALSAASKKDGPSIQKALLKLKYEGPTGITEFDSFGDVQKPFTIYRVKNGEFTPLQEKK